MRRSVHGRSASFACISYNPLDFDPMVQKMCLEQTILFFIIYSLFMKKQINCIMKTIIASFYLQFTFNYRENVAHIICKFYRKQYIKENINWCILLLAKFHILLKEEIIFPTYLKKNTLLVFWYGKCGKGKYYIDPFLLFSVNL